MQLYALPANVYCWYPGTFARLEITQSKPKSNHEDKSKVTQSLLGWEEVGEEEEKKVVWSEEFPRMVQGH